MTIHAEWVRRACPTCGSSNTSSSEVSSKTRAESLSLSEVREYFIGLRNEQVFFSYHRCEDCNLLYCPYYFSESQLDALYSDMPDNLLGAEKSTAEKTQLGYFRFFQREIGEVASYLELGPDIGLVTKAVIETYHPTEINLIEPNSSMHEILKSISKAHEISIYRNLEDVDVKNVDLTIGIHVFDHLLDPSKQINRIFQHTKNGGILGVVVHNESSLLKKIIRKKWPPFCLQHPQLYNKETLPNVMKKFGFEEIRISNSINHFSLKHLGTLAAEIFGLPKFLTRPLPAIELPVVLGNQISIFRKPY
jgi:hypothetical protein